MFLIATSRPPSFVRLHHAFNEQIKLSTLFLATLFCLLYSLAAGAVQNYPFRLHSINTTNQHLVITINEGPATITVVIKVSGNNFKSNRHWPITETIAPHTSKQLGWIQAANPQRGYSFTTDFNYDFGDVNRAPE
jgi:uncharacterized membrane protein YpjA